MEELITTCHGAMKFGGFSITFSAQFSSSSFPVVATATAPARGLVGIVRKDDSIVVGRRSWEVSYPGVVVFSRPKRRFVAVLHTSSMSIFHFYLQCSRESMFECRRLMLNCYLSPVVKL